jgi:hypothetical protein
MFRAIFGAVNTHEQMAYTMCSYFKTRYYLLQNTLLLTSKHAITYFKTRYYLLQNTLFHNFAKRFFMKAIVGDELIGSLLGVSPSLWLIICMPPASTGSSNLILFSSFPQP